MRSSSSRLDTIFKKAHELTILCNIELCVIHYGPDGELKTWPEDRDKVRDIALRYIQLDLPSRRKKSYDLSGFLEKTKKTKYLVTKKTKMTVDPITHHYSPDQIIQSLELTLIKLQDRLRFLESRKQNPNHGDVTLSPPSFLNHPQYLNPNHGGATLSQTSNL